MNSRRLSFIFSSLVVVGFLSACGQFRARSVADANLDEAKQKMFTEPTEPLTPSSPAAADPYSVYQIGNATFGVDAKIQSLSARVDVQSTAGVETVELVGSLRHDGSASLLDLAPLPNGKNRLVGEALCADLGVCKKIILNVYYNVGGKTLKKQFSSDSLKVATVPVPAPPQLAPTSIVPTKIVPAEKDPTALSLKDETLGSDEKPGDFVGAPRNEILIGKLWPRSATPTLPPVLKDVKTGAPATILPSTKEKPPAKVKPATLAEGRLTRWKNAIENYWHKKSAPVAQPAAKPKPAAAALPPVSKSAPAPKPVPPPVAAPEKPVATPIAPLPVRRPLPVKPEPQPLTPIPGKPIAQMPAQVIPPPVIAATPAPTPAYPFPPAVVSSTESDLEQKIGALETKLAPLMNLRDGGEARGSYGPSENPKSSVVNANLLPTIPGLVPILINANAHYGSGLLVSFLENAATYLWRELGLTLFVGDMSLKTGGSYGHLSAHHTHRNGLDADLAWLGIRRPLIDSALDSHGHMVENFDFEKTWNFLSLAAHQELVEDAQKTTAVSRIYMSHHVKDGFCAWAKDQKLLDDPFNSELMRLVRREEGHVKHFHLSLKCSPHYPLCRNLAGPPPPGPGC